MGNNIVALSVSACVLPVSKDCCIVQDIIIEENQVFFQIEDAKVHVCTGNIQIEEIGMKRSSKRQDSTHVFWICSNRIYYYLLFELFLSHRTGNCTLRGIHREFGFHIKKADHLLRTPPESQVKKSTSKSGPRESKYLPRDHLSMTTRKPCKTRRVFSFFGFCRGNPNPCGKGTTASTILQIEEIHSFDQAVVARTTASTILQIEENHFSNPTPPVGGIKKVALGWQFHHLLVVFIFLIFYLKWVWGEISTSFK